jgi:hypothetical protein
MGMYKEKEILIDDITNEIMDFLRERGFYGLTNNPNEYSDSDFDDYMYGKIHDIIRKYVYEIETTKNRPNDCS